MVSCEFFRDRCLRMMESMRDGQSSIDVMYGMMSLCEDVFLIAL